MGGSGSAVHIPKERLRSRLRLVAEQRVTEILAIELDAYGIIDARDMRERGKKIGHPDDGVGVGTVGGDVAGPARDERLAETTFEHVTLSSAEWSSGVDVVCVDADRSVVGHH